MERNNIYSRTVEFRDADKNACKVEINLYKDVAKDALHYETLQPVSEVVRFSACGETGRSMGQCDESIKPRTEGQRKLLWMWNEYHMNDMRCGTKAQSDYINSEQYKEDYNAFVEFYKWADDKSRSAADPMDVTLWMQERFGGDEGNYSIARSVVYNNMDDKAVRYVLGLENDKWHTYPPHGLHDYYTRCFFLAIRGLLIDRGYTYGKKWLVNPLPDDIEEQIDAVCDLIEEEEDELTEQLEAVFDMGANEFYPTDEIIQQVMELRDCDEDEARHFLALGMHLECTFGDLNDTFENVSDHLYSANGIEYYIGTDEELDSIARDIVFNDPEYEYFWREAVAQQTTTEGCNEWLKDLIDTDGWCSILNHYDGNYNEYCIGDNKQYICVSRT